MTEQQNKIIQNDLLLAEHYADLTRLTREMSLNYDAITGLLKSNCQIRQDISGTVENVPSFFEPEAPDLTLQSKTSVETPQPQNLGTGFQILQALFPDVTVSYITDKRDDRFIRETMSRLAITIEKVIAPVIKNERRIYQTSTGDCVLFRLTKWNSDYKPNSIGFSIDQKELELFNHSKYLVIARYKTGVKYDEGFEDWALYNIDGLALDISKDGKTIEYRKYDDSQVIRIEPLTNDPANPFFYLRFDLSDRNIEPTLQG